MSCSLILFAWRFTFLHSVGFFAAFLHNFSPFCNSTWMFVLCYLLNLPGSFTGIPWKHINIHTHFRVAPNHKKIKMSYSCLPGFLWFINNFPVSQKCGFAHNNHEHLSHTKFFPQADPGLGFLMSSCWMLLPWKSCSIFAQSPKPSVKILIFVSTFRMSMQLSDEVYTTPGKI